MISYCTDNHYSFKPDREIVLLIRVRKRLKIKKLGLSRRISINKDIISRISGMLPSERVLGIEKLIRAVKLSKMGKGKCYPRQF